MSTTSLPFDSAVPPHILAIDQTLLYAILTLSKELAPSDAIEMIADARADAMPGLDGSQDRESAVLHILDRTGPLIDGIFARILAEIGPVNLPR